MSDAEIMILGKLVLTFGVLLGLPLLDLYLLRRERYRRTARTETGRDGDQAASSAAPGS